MLVLALSVGFTLRLRGAVLKPLTLLTDAAHRFGRGGFEPRIGDIGRGELADLARAFDQSYLKTMTPDDRPETLWEELAIVDEEASHCQRIAEDLLSCARAGELVLDRIHADTLLDETARRPASSFPGRAGPVVVEAEPVDFDAHSSRLRQVVLNLLMNAIQASPPEAPVTLRGVLDGSHYQMDVEDRGPGVAPENRQRVFEPEAARGVLLRALARVALSAPAREAEPTVLPGVLARDD